MHCRKTVFGIILYGIQQNRHGHITSQSRVHAGKIRLVCNVILRWGLPFMIVIQRSILINYFTICFKHQCNTMRTFKK